MKKANLELLNVRDFEAFGQTVKIKDLTIGESMSLQSLTTQDQVFALVSMMMVEPSMKPDDVKDLPTKYMEDITRLVEESQST